MSRTDRHWVTRRGFLQSTGMAVAGLAIGRLPAQSEVTTGRLRQSLRIGIIGSGQMGGAVGLKWAQAGHQVFFSSRNPDRLADLVAEAGPNAQAGLPNAAASFGEVVLIAVPYGALPQVGRDYGPLMQGKVVIDLGNPREDRDGPMAVDAIARGTGVVSAEYLLGVRLVRALSAISSTQVRNAPRPPRANRSSDRGRRPRGRRDRDAARRRCGIRSGARRTTCPGSRIRSWDRGLRAGEVGC